jgi:hypothetical protein
MQNCNNPILGSQTADLINTLYQDANIDYGEIFYEFGIALDLIKEGIKLTLPTGLHPDIASKIIA